MEDFRKNQFKATFFNCFIMSILKKEDLLMNTFI